MSKTAFVSGASSGIGYEIAKLLAKDGYNLVITSRSESKFFEIKPEFEELYNIKVMIIPIDLTIPFVADEVYAGLIKKKISVDVLVNSAGMGDYGAFADCDWMRNRQMLQLNVIASTHLTRLFVEDMIKKGSGRILNIASTAAFHPGPLMSVFFATQAYMLSFTEALASELRGTGVSVSILCPGPTQTDFQRVSNMQNTRIFKGRKMASPESVAEYGYKAMMRGQTVAIHGLSNKLLTVLSKFLPRKLLTGITHYFQEEVN